MPRTPTPGTPFNATTKKSEYESETPKLGNIPAFSRVRENAQLYIASADAARGDPPSTCDRQSVSEARR